MRISFFCCFTSSGLFRLFFSLIFALILVSCSTESQKQSGTSSKSNGLDPRLGLETIAILGTNDIHGTLAPLQLRSKEKHLVNSVPYEAAGVPALASYIQILRSEFGERFIWLDAGDEFQGSIESNLAYGKPVVEVFNQLGLSAAAVGNHEFDFGKARLKERMQEANYPYLAANIRDSATLEPAKFPNMYPSKLFEAGKLKVGVIGLSTLETPVQTVASNVAGLQFEDLKTATLREATQLRKHGANVVLLTAHVGIKCKVGSVSTSNLMRKEEDPQGDCGYNDELVRLLRTLPTGTIDAVVSGHSHQVIHHWIAGVPVIQGGAFGRYVNVIYLTYDWAQRKLWTDQTRIEGPVPICAMVFENQNDCFGDRPAPKTGRGPLVRARFHGKEIQPDPKIMTLLKPVLERSNIAKEEILGTADRPVENPAVQESELGNFAADALRAAVNTDFGLVTHKALRAPLESGPISFDALFRTYPFENEISIVHVTEKELRLILRVAESGARGIASVSGLKLKLIPLNAPAPSDDLNGDGRDDPWKTNRILDISLSNGKPLVQDRLYSLAVPNFLITGGDDFGWPMGQIPRDRIEASTGKLVRDALADKIRTSSPLNSTQHPLMDRNHPRIAFVHPERPKKPHRTLRHKKRHITT